MSEKLVNLYPECESKPSKAFLLKIKVEEVEL